MVLDKEQFLDEYRMAVQNSGLYNTTEEIKWLVLEIWLTSSDRSDTLDNNSDPLYTFLNEQLNNWSNLEWLMQGDLEGVWNLDLSTAPLLKSGLRNGKDLMNALSWKKFVLGNRILIFSDKDIGLYDITKLDSEVLEKMYNDESIKAVDRLIANGFNINDAVRTFKTSSEFLEFIMKQAQAFIPE